MNQQVGSLERKALPLEIFRPSFRYHLISLEAEICLNKELSCSTNLNCRKPSLGPIQSRKGS
jgi:hypothetical protein